MKIYAHDKSRRSFIGHVAGMGAAAVIGYPEIASATEWDVSWLDAVRKAKHRALFDAPMPGNILDLATRYYNNLQTAYGRSEGSVCMVLNFRTRSTYMGVADPMWQKYPLGEDAKVTDPDTNAPARRNVDLRVSDDKAALGYGSIERLQKVGAIILVCDFALGHLANRLAKATGGTEEAVHAELRSNLVPGAILVPSGIFSAGEAQNAGCAFIPS